MYVFFEELANAQIYKFMSFKKKNGMISETSSDIYTDYSYLSLEFEKLQKPPQKKK